MFNIKKIAKQDCSSINKAYLAIVVIIALIIVVEMGALLMGNFTGQDKTDSFNLTSIPQSIEFQKESKKWADRIDEIGATLAYEEFKIEYEKESSFGMQHTGAHILGELLWEKLSIEGIKICDDSFQFGCYHSFFGKAISEQGVSVISDLHEACIERWGKVNDRYLACQHGIGHGIIALVGYERDSLKEALDLCWRFSWEQEVGGCSAGVFMEYNQRTMLNLSGSYASYRPVNPEDFHDPCSSLPAKFLPACYYNQSVWWKGVLDGDYQKIGRLCNELEDAHLQRICFTGFSDSLPINFHYNVKEVIKVCDQMPSENTRILCRASAAARFAADLQYEHLAPRLCKGLKKEADTTCIQLYKSYQ